MRRNIFYRLLVSVVSFVLLAHIKGGTPAAAAALFDPSKVVFREAIGGLTQPIFIANAGDGSGRLFIVERVGRIRIFKEGMLLPAPFLDIDSIVNSVSNERGLLALAFHPAYKTNGRFYTVHTDENGSLVLSRFLRSANPDLANPNSRITLLTIPHPTHTNHNGGTLAFGPDGYLYWSTGDGGGGGDPFNNAQNLNSLLGKILRLDVDHTSPGLNYAIPPSNPFYNMPNRRGEIWAYGLRNPWRISFDRGTGNLFIGDVGQSAREEIDFQPAGSAGGQNYGWRIMEGSQCYDPPSGCNTSGKVLPVAEYSHSLGCSVTGGYMYRGASFPDMQGRYFYADFCSGILFSLYNDPTAGWTAAQVRDTPYSVTSFGEDEHGELYLTDYNTGKVYQICYGSLVDVNITVAGASRGSLPLCRPQVLQKTLAGVSAGPARITSVGNLPSLASERVIYKVNNVDTSFSEMMALPNSRLDTTYWLPYYNNVDLDTQLRIANVSGVTATVRLYIGGQEKTSGCTPSNSPYTLQQGASLRVSCPGVNGGPVQIVSTQNIVAAERVIYTAAGGTPLSFSEMMALPNSQLDTVYWLPWYNNVDLDTQLRLGNAGGSTATVHVTIGGQPMQGSPFTVQPGQSQRVSFPGVNAGPVKIESNVGLVAAERLIYKVNGQPTSFSEMMAMPSNELNTTYWLPWYNNGTLDTQLRFANVSGSQAQVHVYIGGVEMAGSPFPLAPGASVRRSFAGVNNGPVKIQSNANIVAAERVIYSANNTPTSFSETMALPGDQLDAIFWLPFYNSVELNTQLWFGVP